MWGLVVLVPLLLCAAQVTPDRTPPEVQTSAGNLRGRWLETRGGRDIAAFLGIPYAAPPVGELRFQAPRPARPWSGTRNAADFASECPQRNVYMRKEAITGDEDCLYLNVFKPEGDWSEPLPVLFYIHGGGWLSGSGALYGPEYLLDRDIILVTLNYRLGPLGFLSMSDDLLPGNNGLKDMVLALQWVKEHIRAFGGGGPVTVAGESAGGAAVHLLCLSPLADGLFQRAIAMSGNGLTPWAVHVPGEARRQARVLASHTHCPATPTGDLLRCLRSKSVRDIISVDKQFMEWDYLPSMPFKATVEAGPDPFLDMHPREAYAAGRLQQVPFMTGFTSQEGVIFATAFFENETNLQDLNDRFTFVATALTHLGSYPELMREETFQRVREFYFGDGPIGMDAAFNIIDMTSDAVFIYPVLEGVKLHKKYSKAPVFLYEFAHLSQAHSSFSTLFGASSADFGVCHADDLLYVFPLSPPFPGNLSGDDLFVSRKFVDFLVNFAVDGKPTADRSWQEVKHPAEAEYMHIGSPGDIATRANFAPRRMQLWSELPIQLGRLPPGLHDEL